MVDVRGAAAVVLTLPNPDGLWALRSRLLEAGVPCVDPVWGIVGEFHRFLDELGTRSSAREYSHLASKLDISAVGGVAVEQLLETEAPKETSMRLLSALLGEGLMVLATRQHVKAWEGALGRATEARTLARRPTPAAGPAARPGPVGRDGRRDQGDPARSAVPGAASAPPFPASGPHELTRRPPT
jgi:hypothetical protein